MKKLCNVALLLFLLLLVGCTSDTNGETDPSEDDSVLEERNETEESDLKNEDNDEPESGAEEAGTDNSNENSSDDTRTDSNNTSQSKENNTLADHSSEEIEYARVWLQLGPNQEIDELNVRHIPAGTPLNSDDETSAGYPEDVIQLSGSRLVDGSITYSGNGDGTINIYNVPLRWDGEYPAGEAFYIDIIENTDQAYIDPGEDEKVIELIEIQNHF